MPITVKLLDRDLIRLVGSTIATINDSHAKRYIAQGRAKIVKQPKDEEEKKRDEDRKKSINQPPEDKTMWRPPEQKAFPAIPVKISTPFPGPNDVLFTHI